MSKVEDFVIENGALKKYKGKGGDVVIPEGVTSIGESAFSYCTRLTSVTVPKNAEIADYAFPETTEVIRKQHFANREKGVRMSPIKMRTSDGELVSVYQISVLDKEYDLGDYRIVAVV